MSDSKKGDSNMGIFILLFFGIAVAYGFSRRSPVQDNYEQPRPRRLRAAYQPDSIPRITPNNYDNEEVREITYNDDGLPTRIVIHRHAATS